MTHAISRPAEVSGSSTEDFDALQKEVVRLNKIVRVLMDRAERSASVQGSDFNLFQTTILLEEQVRRRTAELEEALRANEAITNALRASEERFRGLVSQSLVGITIFEGGTITYANDTFSAIFGRSAEELKALDPVTLYHPDDLPEVQEHVRRRFAGEVESSEYRVRGVRPDGSIVYVEIHGNTMNLNGERVLISMYLDVTDRVAAENELLLLQEQLRETSVRDALTGLHNRRHFETCLAKAVAQVEEAGIELSLIITDIDHFKSVNDTYGHPVGDQLLRVFAETLAGHGREETVFRYGGEEFVILLPRVSLEKAMQRAECLREAVESSRVETGDQTLKVTASFGVACLPRHGHDGEALLVAADKALYQAKTGGRNKVVASE